MVLHDFAASFVTSTASVFLLYPYRDYVKQYPSTSIDKNFIVGRYRGLTAHPHQLGIIATPYALLFGLSTTSIPLACATYAAARTANRALVQRVQKETTAAGNRLFKSEWDCAVGCTRKYGILAWFSGISPAFVLTLVTSGASLSALNSTRNHARNRHGDRVTIFFQDFVSFSRTHAMFTFISSPLRTSLRSATFVQLRGSSQFDVVSFARNEANIFFETATIAKRMFQDNGIRYFFSGNIRSIFKVTFPLAFNYSLFRQIC